ncbi:MAG TPA: class A beta-lactamase [Thermoanaerobaculia bacterium]|jgi:beta-lactamase class A|nr:class A beta-lactamase [Thermoanaerobaculia bacterium]
MITFVLAALLTLPPQSSDAVIGVAAIHLESGRSVGVRGTERFPMGSVYKFPIVIAALQRVDAGTLKFDQTITIDPKDFSPGWSPIRDDAKGKPVTLTVRELLRSTVSISDNTASDATVRLLGGPAAIQKVMNTLGVPGIRIDREERTIAKHLDEPNGRKNYASDVRDSSTPDEMAKLLVAFFHRRNGLSKASHDLLMQWMIDTPTGVRRIKAVVPKGSVVAHKTGSMPGTVNDVGIVTAPDGKDHVVIVVLSKAGTSEEKLREDDVAAAAKAAYAALMEMR